MAVIGMIFFFIFLLLGITVIPFGIAGTFIIFFDALIYGWITGFERVTWPFLGILLGLAVIVEIIEALLGAVMARRYGGSKWAMAGAILGMGAGAVLGTVVTPVIGTIIGGFAGAFAGATLLEWMHSPDVSAAVKVGTGALLGAVGGKMTKLLVAVLMVVLILVRIL